ncbi:MAG: flagellar motor protein MotB [Deltaproteobacteria bacterium]|nr:flagellar motor protein MotB [Deltaproteobacteria bacterium]
MSPPRKSYFARKPSTGGAEDDWVITFADAMTLLLAFFVMLFAISDVDQAKYEEIKSLIVGEVTKKAVPRPITELAQSLNQIVASSDMAGQIIVEKTRQGLAIEFTGTSLFAPGSAELKKAAKPLLAQVVSALGLISSDNYVVEVGGHTDDEPINTPQFPSNWELSAARATNVVRYLITAGMAADRLQASGFADTRPKVPNKDIYGSPVAEHRAMNRRVVIEVKRPS